MKGLVLRAADLKGLDFQGESVCGIDEAGRGPLAGPVCAVSVILPRDFPIAILDDSKALSPAKRVKAYDIIVTGALDWAIAWATYEEIGEINILRASLLAMRRSFLALSVNPKLVLVDGNTLPDIPAKTMAVIKGDSLVPAIMAASILAKVARDRLMDRLDRIEPEYGFAAHRGYPTAAHREVIKKIGPSLWARPGFKIS
ncbi:MAG: ribonuclease HII [Spirochaetes bacterium]|nr:ribonuclease HII [Spirochaetota bacterium]